MNNIDRDWVAAAAERAEQRLRGEAPTFTTARDQLQTLVAAILDTKVSRTELRRLADNLRRGRAA